MPSITLKAGAERLIPTSGMFLSIINANGNFKVESPQFGVVVGEVGRQYELQGVNQVNFVNPGVIDLDIEFEVANIKVHTSGKGLVTVGNEIVVKRIVEQQSINANATVENGKMSSLASNVFEALAPAKTIIAAGATVEVVAARAGLNRLVTIQLITDSPEMGELRLGSNVINAPNGLFIQGHKDAPGGYEWATETAVFVYNPTANPVTIAGGEQWRA